MLKCLNVQTLERSKSQRTNLSNARTLQCRNAPTLERSNSNSPRRNRIDRPWNRPNPLLRAASRRRAASAHDRVHPDAAGRRRRAASSSRVHPRAVAARAVAARAAASAWGVGATLLFGRRVDVVVVVVAARRRRRPRRGGAAAAPARRLRPSGEATHSLCAT